jgi:formylglycine-generating enzyme required for sulfatase activity
LIATKNVGATIYIPTLDEWYKAAYYNGANSTYSPYPNGQNSITTADANYGYSVGSSTDVGTYSHAPSSYGTFDQGGNVWELTDTLYYGISTQVFIRGGGWAGHGEAHSSLQGGIDATWDRMFLGSIGFRVASVPEPSALLLSILASGVMLIRRKR